MMARNKIGVYDSGVGGLIIAEKLHRLIPQVDVYFVADTKHMPYGEKSRAEIIEYSRSIINFLISKGCQTILIACNTASSLAYPILKDEYLDIHLIDVITPTVNAITKPNDVLVLATAATAHSHAYRHQIAKLFQNVSVNEIGAPSYVLMVEYQDIKEEEIKNVIDRFDYDTVVLGCTHFIVLKPYIQRLLPKAHIVDSSMPVIKQMQKQLRMNDNHDGELYCYMTDYSERLLNVTNSLFEEDIKFSVIEI